MVVEYIRYKLSNEDECLALEQAYLAAQKTLMDSVHFLGLEMCRCEEEESIYVVRIEWDSTKGHMEGFRKSPEFSAFFTLVRPFFQKILDMRHYQVRFSQRSQRMQEA